MPRHPDQPTLKRKMIRINSPFGKSVAVLSTFSLVFCLFPSFAWAKTVKDTQDWVKSKLPPVTPDVAPSKVLSAARMKASQGRSGENPYAAGQAKWDVVYKGVNLMNGSFTANGNDLTFEGGYGIPVNVTRSYSSNNGEEGPLGKGWSLSVDTRSTAGGLIKKAGSAVRSIPVNFKERPSTQVDPNAEYGNGANANTTATSPVSAVLASDAGGTEETMQRDADGIITTPPWDKNKVDSIYETYIDANGTNWQLMTHNVVNTPEGTVYVYDKQGNYIDPNNNNSRLAVRPFNNPSANPEPSNVLKITSATDRQGNLTTYTYGTGYVSFTKTNGTTQEHPLTQVQMPNGHQITFGWTGNRITTASDGVRTVQYGYTGGLLTSVTTPGNKTTNYGYGNGNEAYQNGPDAETNIITSVTDPRGLMTTISYAVEFLPRFGWTTTVRRMVAPNGMKTDFYVTSFDGLGTGPIADVFDYVGANYDPSTGPVSGLIHGFEVKQSLLNGVFSVFACQSRKYQEQDAGYNLNLWEKDYDQISENLVTETNNVYYRNNQPDRFVNPYTATPGAMTLTAYATTSTTYNFMGHPLNMTGSEYHLNNSGNMQLDRSTSTSYSYWGAEKYYQQKATKDTNGRLSFADYYDYNAAQGKKGQTYRLYDQARATINLNNGASIPSYAQGNTAVYWRYQIQVADPSQYSAQFDYDTKGRPIDAWKIRDKGTTPYTYVRTHTSYGADAAPVWGAPNQVIEDYGGLNRTANSLAYDSFGRETTAQDPSGRILQTTYDADGLILSVAKIVGATSTPIATYTYGTSGLVNGQIVSIVDNLSGVSQAFNYVTSGIGIGLISSIYETNASDSYAVSFTYNASGDIDTETISTQSAFGLSSAAKWQYHDYLDVGTDKPLRAYQTLTGVDPNTGSLLPEEFQYQFDTFGRPCQATYAMTPQAGYVPSAGGSFYDPAHTPTTRGRSYFAYDGGGRKIGVYNWWDAFNNGAYTSSPIRANECAYETSGLSRGLKTLNRFYNVSSGAWNLQRTESYGYDANLDYLTSANYGDGLANATPSWTYDDAGNRISDSSNPGTWSYDNLNRLTASPTVSIYSNDVLGNRTQAGVTGGTNTMTYGWDDLNRMTSLNIGANNSNAYVYRADGLRVYKTSTGSASTQSSTRYRYRGQMGIEDVELDSSLAITAINRYALGIRGVDAISRTTSSGTSVSYPLYDVHGNNVGLLAKSGSTWNISDERSYDAWGQVRSGASNGAQKGRYCAGVGHKADDESGLVYMRARYYEPTSGRFISSDPGKNGPNWYVYCKNDPLRRQDSNGRYDWIESLIEELFKGLVEGKGNDGKTWIRITYKCFEGWHICVVTKAAIETCMQIAKDTSEASAMLNRMGNPWAANAAETIGGYAIILVLFIDAVDIIANEALVDFLFDGGKKMSELMKSYKEGG